jgi:hypothetical protein
VVAGRSVCRLSTIRSVDGGTGSAQPPPLCAESPQLYRESDHRFDAPAKPVGRQQIPHFATPPSATSGFEDMILLRTGGLAASPPVRYTLETADQCLTAAVALRGAVRGRLRRGGGPPGRPVREACNERCQSRGPDASGEVVSLVRPLRADYYRFRSVSDRHAAWSEQYLRVGLSGLEPLTSIRGVYGGRTAAGDASRASGEVRSDPRRGRAVVKQNDKQTASRDDRAHRFGPPA